MTTRIAECLDGSSTGRASLADRALALHELRMDPVYRLISPCDREAYTEGSLTIGRETAAAYPNADPAEIATRLGASIVYSDSHSVVGADTLRAQYDSGTRIITVYTQSIAEIAQFVSCCSGRGDTFPSPGSDRQQIELIRKLLDSALDRGWSMRVMICRIHIAHELFHHLEATLIGRTDERFPTVAFRAVGPFKGGAMRIRQCREIAAHAFVKELLALPFLPNLIDLCMQRQR